MRVPTKLKSISYILVTAIILLLSTIFWLLIISRSANSDLKLADEIQANFLERTSLRDRYFLYHEEFIRIQWEKSKQLSDSLLRQARLQLRDKKSLENIDALVRNIDDTAAIFNRIVANSNALKSAGGNREILEELDKRLSSQLLLKATLIRDTTFLLKNSALKSVQQRYRQLTVTILLLAFSLSIGIILWNILLKQQVQSKTIHLENEMAERKLVNEELKKMKNMLSDGEMISHMGTFEYVADTRTTFWSEGEYCIYGLDPEGTSPTYNDMLAKCIHPDDVALLHQTFTVAIQSGSVYELEHRIVRPDGSVRWVLDRAKPYFDQNSKLVGYIGSTLDITESKRIEQELQAKNTEMERFAYTVSHDLKSPLITIQSYAGMINKDLEKGKYERAQDDMKRIEGAADKMTSLLNDLLELSRAGRQMGEPSLIDMNRLIGDVLVQLTGVIEQSLVEVVLQPDLPTVLGDQKRIAQVVQNLIENAIKYRGDQAAPRIEIGTRQEGTECVFFVSDNCKGIDPRHFEKVFGLFNKLDAKSEGTGVGLALVKRIIEVHGGRVWVESDGEGMGSCFCFTMEL